LYIYSNNTLIDTLANKDLVLESIDKTNLSKIDKAVITLEG